MPLQANLDRVIADPDLEGLHGFSRRQAEGTPGRQVELRAVQVALDHAVPDLTLRQKDLTVAALIDHCVEATPAIDETDLSIVDEHLQGAVQRHLACAARCQPPGRST